jgi:hypothetical protein
MVVGIAQTARRRELPPPATWRADAVVYIVSDAGRSHVVVNEYPCQSIFDPPSAWMRRF